MASLVQQRVDHLLNSQEADHHSRAAPLAGVGVTIRGAISSVATEAPISSPGVHDRIISIQGEGDMSTAQEARNKETYHRFHEAINSGDLEVISKAVDELIHPDGQFHTAERTDANAVQAQKRIWEVLLRAYPDIRITLEDLIAEEDKIVARQTVTGTNSGEYRGMPPTGKSVTYHEIFIIRFADGQITDIWGVVDLYSQLRQLGHIPA
ncbi:ester cyclase [Nonomuraea sp. NPDC049129]|uniref:ester cyclase n=1 Tax=Nonomuraea sp. NPDC049129 TaxID=3155272 RepID=UPI0033E1BF2D